MKRYGLLALCLTLSFGALAQTPLTAGTWHAALLRKDGQRIPFTLDVVNSGGKPEFYILNASERIKTQEPELAQDSLLIKMPVFESYFKVKIISKDSLSGFWVSGAGAGDVAIPFSASAGKARFPASRTIHPKQVKGKWSITFLRANNTERAAIGQIFQKGRLISGSVLTPSGDYRYLEGVVSSDSLFLSTFDGSHALLLAAKIEAGKLTGNFYSGVSGKETWTAVKNNQASLKVPKTAITALKETSSGRPDFTFNDLQNIPVSLHDDRFKGKVIVLQLMGSWCPNCMDETAFLSAYYEKNKARGVEIIALGFELSTDQGRSIKSLQKFQTQFNVQYPILNTGVTASDPLRAEKTFPDLTAIKVFPTTLILDKNGLINHISTTFYGPGAGLYHEKYKADFEKTIDILLAR